MNKIYDVIIIGAGVVGCATARELSKYDIDTLVIEKNDDVSCGASKANSGIIHGGYDAKSGSVKGSLSALGNSLFTSLDKELNFGHDRCGSMVLAFDEEDEKTIENLYENGKKNNIEKLSIIDREEILKREPYVSENVTKALLSETAGIVIPFEYALALAENAVANGTDFVFNKEVKSINKNKDLFYIQTNDGIYKTKYIINAAGMYADKISNMIAKTDFTITPRRGEYMLFDKSEGKFAKNVIFQTPKQGTKGILVTPTLHGNLMIGPSAEFIKDKEGTETTVDILDMVWNTAAKSVPNLDKSKIITQFSGLRAATDKDDFIIEESNINGFINAACVDSPGLTTSYAIALKLRDILDNAGLKLSLKKDFNPYREGYVHIDEMSEEMLADLIKKDERYGRVICRCETITEGQIINAITRGLPVTSVDAVKRRIRAGMGRCQGGFCLPRVMEILKEHNNMKYEDITKKGNGSYILTGKTDKGVM